MRISNLPKKLKIWGHEYRVLKQKDPKTFDGKEAVSCLGWCSNNEQTIAIKSGMKLSREVEVLLHEIFHAISYNSDIFTAYPNSRELEEHVVNSMANGLTLILKDNKELVDYIKESLH